MSSVSTFFGLNTALRGLQAQQRELDITAHNVANAETEGYSRQSVSLEAVPGLKIDGIGPSGAGAMLGGGVDVATFNRARDSFTDLQYRASSTQLGQSATSARALSDAESAMLEPGDQGVAKLLSNFWDGWQELATNPESQAARSALVVSGQSLADGLHSLDAQFASVQTDAQNQLTTMLSSNGDILSGARAIAALNVQIDHATASGGTANDLLDKRDLLVDKLSSLGQVTVTNLPTGGIQVAFGGVSSPLLVDDQTSAASVPTLTAPGGKVGALMQLASVSSPVGTLQGYRNTLDSIASTLVTAVNTAHGAPFFSTTGTTASTIAIDATVAASPSTVRTTALAGSPAGANDVALAVANLRKGTADQTYSGLVLKIGADASAANTQKSSAQATVDAASDKRASTSGVSLDEEMANMVRFQRSYQASARAMSTIDQMLDTLINRAGAVGL